MLRWSRKGVGLRGINGRTMPIDQDEEEDIVKVFRKERVEIAVSEAVSRVSAIIGYPCRKAGLPRDARNAPTSKGEAMICGVYL